MEAPSDDSDVSSEGCVGPSKLPDILQQIFVDVENLLVAHPIYERGKNWTLVLHSKTSCFATAVERSKIF